MRRVQQEHDVWRQVQALQVRGRQYGLDTRLHATRDTSHNRCFYIPRLKCHNKCTKDAPLCRISILTRKQQQLIYFCSYLIWVLDVMFNDGCASEHVGFISPAEPRIRRAESVPSDINNRIDHTVVIPLQYGTLPNVITKRVRNCSFSHRRKKGSTFGLLTRFRTEYSVWMQPQHFYWTKSLRWTLYRLVSILVELNVTLEKSYQVCNLAKPMFFVPWHMTLYVHI